MSDMSKSDSLLYSQLATIIEQGKQRVTAQLNSTIVFTYWHIGNTINEHILKNERAEYGKETVTSQATQLSWSHFLQLFQPENKQRERIQITNRHIFKT